MTSEVTCLTFDLPQREHPVTPVQIVPKFYGVVQLATTNRYMQNRDKNILKEVWNMGILRLQVTEI